MVRPFGKLEKHRRHVLQWYRYSLRNIGANLESANTQVRIRDVLKRTVRENMNHKSSWHVKGLLEDLTLLNQHIVSDDVQELKSLVEKYEKRISVPVQPSSKVVRAKIDTNYKSAGRIESDEVNWPLVNRFIFNNYTRHGFNVKIPTDYKKKLLLPLAYHEQYCKTLHLIEYRLAKGPPKVSINYTGAGQSRIWFVRSPMNRKSRQSKRLSTLIRRARVKSQENLDTYRKCQNDITLAYQEAQWEFFLHFGRAYDVTVDALVSKLKRRDHSDVPEVFRAWIQPLLDEMDRLTQQNERMKQRFVKGKDELIQSKQYDYYKRLTTEMYKRRLERFIALKSELYTVNPFSEQNNLGSLLVKWKFLQPHNLLEFRS